MPAMIKTHQRIINIQPKEPNVPNPKFIILLFVELLPKGDDHPPHIMFIMGIQPPLVPRTGADESHPESLLPITTLICSSPFPHAFVSSSHSLPHANLLAFVPYNTHQARRNPR